MTEKVQFVDFGVPDSFGTHVFRVEIPAARTEPVALPPSRPTRRWSAWKTGPC